MKIQQLRSWLAFITGAVVLGLLIGLGVKISFFNAYAQSDKKTVKLAFTIKPQLKFKDLKVAQKDLKLDEGFDAELDWVKNLSFKLENISDKPIVFIQVNLNFPETRLTGNMMSYQLMLGEIPGKKFKGSKQMLLKPDETLEVSLDKEKDKIYKFLNERQPIETIQKVELEIGLVVFEDKTAWASGTFLRQDSYNPNRYKRIEDEPQQ